MSHNLIVWELGTIYLTKKMLLSVPNLWYPPTALATNIKMTETILIEFYQVQKYTMKCGHNHI